MLVVSLALPARATSLVDLLVVMVVFRIGVFETLDEFPSGFHGLKGGEPSDPRSPLGQIAIDGRGIPGAPSPRALLPAPFCLTDTRARICVADPRPNVSSADIVLRLGDVDLPQVGDLQTVSIDVLGLSLGAVTPIEVGYGTQPSSFFDVFFELDPQLAQPGTATLQLTAPDEGTLDVVLPLALRMGFRGLDPSDPQAGTVSVNLLLTGQTTWVIVPEPGSLALLGLALASLAAAPRRRRYSALWQTASRL